MASARPRGYCSRMLIRRYVTRARGHLTCYQGCEKGDGEEGTEQCSGLVCQSGSEVGKEDAEEVWQEVYVRIGGLRCQENMGHLWTCVCEEWLNCRE